MNDIKDLNSDFLTGAKAIGAYLGVGERTVFHFVSTQRLPVVKLGTKLIARKSALLRWFEAQEQVAFEATRKAA